MEEVKQEQKITAPAPAPSSSFLVTLLSVSLLTACLIAGFFAHQTQKLVKELQIAKNQALATPVSVSPSNLSPTSTCVPLPDCAYNTDPKKATCKIGEYPPDGGSWCPKPTESPSIKMISPSPQP